MKKILVAASLLMLSFTTFAQQGPRAYAALGGGLLTFDDGYDQVDPIQLFGRLGYDFNQYFGIGFEGGFSLIEDELYGVDFDVSTLFFYLKASIPIDDGAKFYALVGPTNVELTGSLGSVSASADDDDTGVGFGFEKSLDTLSVSFDYVIYNNNEGVDVDAFNLGFVSYF